MTLDKREALKKINEKTNEADKLIEEATEIADQYGISFSFSVAYGMGGVYHPKKQQDNWETSSFEDDDEGWVSSSEMC